MGERVGVQWRCFVPQSSTQRQKIKDYLWSRFGQWVSLPEILPFAAQYSARIHELRKELRPRGYDIENKTETQPDGTRRSWFKLGYAAAIDVTPEPAKSTRHERASQFDREFRPKPRPGWQPKPFSEKRMSQDDCFRLTPPTFEKARP